MDIKTYAALLFVGQFVSVAFMALILKRQVRLFKTNIQTDLIVFRRVQFSMTLGIFLCALTFIGINVLTISGHLTRSTNTINPAGIIYGTAITAAVLLFSILTWLLYRMAAKILIYSSPQNHGKEVQ